MEPTATKKDRLALRVTHDLGLGRYFGRLKMPWEDGLPTFDVSGLQTLFPADQSRDAQASLTDERTYGKTRKHTYQSFLKVANAAKALQRLPDEGESIHCVMAGNFDGFDLVSAILRLAQPAIIKRLLVCTLGFNDRGIEELCRLFDAGQIGKISFVCSTYFKSVDHTIYDRLYSALSNRGQRLRACRSHAKILGFAMSDGTAYTIEGSQNLRSCRNVEQFVLTCDPGLLAFHEQWTEELLQ